MKSSIVSINIGRPTLLIADNNEVSSAINKSPVGTELCLSFLNFDGDEQADKKHHGGRDKAVCVYSYDHYRYWEEELDRKLSCGAFGENVTVTGLCENQVCIGDIYQLGGAVVQVSQPREPCHKLAKKHKRKDLPALIQETGFTGFYVRVLKEGLVSVNSSFDLLEKHPQFMTIDEANRIMYSERGNHSEINKLLHVQELSDSWRKTLISRLDHT